MPLLPKENTVSLFPLLVWCSLTVLLLLTCSTLAQCAEPSVVINVTGDLTDIQRQNVLNQLSLAKVQGREKIPEHQFNRLYAKITREATKALEPFGYYSAEITPGRTHKGGVWQVDLAIAVGRPIVIREVQVAIDGAGEQDPGLMDAVKAFSMHPGDVLDHQRYEAAKDALIAAALDHGYMKATFKGNRVEIRRKDYAADMHLVLDSGALYQFGPLTFEADFIDHDLLNKISTVKEGDPFTPKALNHLRQSLYGAGYFNAVDLKYNTQKTDSTKVPVTVVLTPNLAHKYGVGLGYGTDTGMRGTLEYANRHINRWGHQLDLQWQPAERKNNFSGVYTIPIGDPKRDRLTILGSYETEKFDNTETEGWTSTVSHDHFREWGEYSTYLQFLDERYTTGANSGHATLAIPGIRGSLFWADDRINTTRGLRLSASLLGSEQTVLGDASFVQASARAKGIYSFFEQWRLIGRADLATTIVDDIFELPPTLRYYAGGDQSVRGYGYRTIGPLDADGNVVGGKNLLVYSLELERALFDEWSAAVFYDCGGASDGWTDITMKSGAGVGVRWKAPFGQVRLDLAKALDDGGNSWRIHFTIGADL